MQLLGNWACLACVKNILNGCVQHGIKCILGQVVIQAFRQCTRETCNHAMLTSMSRPVLRSLYEASGGDGGEYDDVGFDDEL